MDWQKWAYTLASQIPSLTVLDFFFWCHITNIVCAEKIRSATTGQKSAPIETVMPEMLSGVWEEAEYRSNICRATYGAHIVVC